MLSNAGSATRKEKFILMAAVSVITAQSEEVVVVLSAARAWRMKMIHRLKHAH